MKTRARKDWLYAVLMTALFCIAVMGVMFDPSCRRESEGTGSRIGQFR